MNRTNLTSLINHENVTHPAFRVREILDQRRGMGGLFVPSFAWLFSRNILRDPFAKQPFFNISFSIPFNKLSQSDS